MKFCYIDGCNEIVYAKSMCASHYNANRRNGDPLTLRDKKPNGTHFRWIEENKNYDLDDCLIWPFSLQENGYGTASINSKNFMAHRYMCEVVNGKPKKNQVARHSCGNGHMGCVNPKHLSWGSAGQNRLDQFIHQTSCNGEQHPNATLTDEKVLYIIEQIDSGRTQRDIAKEMNIDYKKVNSIHKGRSWSWLTKRERWKPYKAISEYRQKHDEDFQNDLERYLSRIFN